MTNNEFFAPELASRTSNYMAGIYSHLKNLVNKMESKSG